MHTSSIRTAIVALVLTAVATAAPAQSRSTTSAAAPDPREEAPRIDVDPAGQAGDYRLGAGDMLRVEVYKDPQLSQSLQVRPDGRITMPLVGDIVASGYTPLELRDRITAALEEYITSPVVTVIVVEANAAVVYVMGEVNRPGSVPLRGPTTVIQALAMAGGFREWANTRNIQILRRNGHADDQRVETIGFNYRDALRGDRRFVYLQAGDVVVVP